MLALNAYFDETGSEHNPQIKVCGMGGCIAPAPAWESVEAEWQQVLDDYNLTYFHTTDYAQSVKEYKSLKGDTTERHILYNRLWDIIHKVEPMFKAVLCRWTITEAY